MVHIIKYKDTDFYYKESANIKQIYANDNLVCELKTYRGFAKFNFGFKGEQIQIKAIMVLNGGHFENALDGLDFEFVANGKTLREAKSLFKQIPNLLFYMACLITSATFTIYQDVSTTDPKAWVVIPIGGGIALICLISGLLIK